LIDELKPEGIERLRTGLKPQRERFDFAYTMNRWAQLASDTSTVVRVNLFPSEWPTDDGADVVAELPATPSEKGARAPFQQAWPSPP
jgi:hypothetical protein